MLLFLKQEIQNHLSLFKDIKLKLRNSNIVFSVSLISMLMGTSPMAMSATKITVTDEFARGHILVEAMGDVSDDDFTKILAVHKGKKRRMGKSRIHFVDLPADMSEQDLVEKLSRDPRIKYAELDRKIKSTFVPNDPYFGNEWHLPKINSIAAWDGAQGAGITIAILDSGVDPTHPDLVPNLVPGYNFYDNNTDTSDVCGHGTAVAGVAAAVGNNSLGVSGVAPQAKIMPIRIAYKDAATGSCYGYFSTITSGLNWAADHGARIANVSYGGVAGSSAIISAAQYFKSKGGLVFVSAGNSNIDENVTPTTSMIPVSATDSNDLKASWSSYGNFVALSAPGTGIWTTSNGGIYQGWNGTSFSSPLTAGVGALLMSANKNLTPAQVENIMFSTALDLGNAGRDNIFGYGRVDAGAAMQEVLKTNVPVDTQAPAVSFVSPTANSTVAGTVAVSLNATDNVGVTKVEFSVNGNLMATNTTSPFAFSWDSKSLANGAASLSLAAYDAAGNKTTSSISVNINNIVPDTQAPTVAFTSPAANSAVAGVVAVNSIADDNVGVTKVEFKVNGNLLATDTSAPFAFNWDSKTLANGTASLALVAYDAAGNMTTTSVSVTVNNVVADTIAPVVKILSPVAGRVYGYVSIRASATDNSGLAGITQTLFIDGVNIGYVKGGSLSYTWNLRAVSYGTHRIDIKAVDAAGNASVASVLVTK